MIRTFIALAIPLAISQPGFATKSELAIAATIKVDSAPASTVKQRLIPGEMRVVDVPTSPFRIELKSAVKGSSPSTAHIRLLEQDPTMGGYKTVHEASVASTQSSSLQIAYKVCSGKVTFYSPAPSEAPTCAN